jgi:hypothetical protein
VTYVWVLVSHAQNRQIHRDRKWNGGGMGNRMTINDDRISL